jgi:hypothetical protein
MILSKRERTIIGVTLSVLGLFLADRFFLSPILERRTRIEQETGDCELEMGKATALFAQRKRLLPRWKEMTDSGLGSGAGAAESQLLHTIRDLAQEADLTLASVKHERTEMERQFQKTSWRAAGSGTMAAVSRFLFRIQEAAIPVRIADLQLSARQEGTDALALQVGISILSTAPRPEKEKTPAEAPKMAPREVKE